ncbi:CDP-alcohol phosphatidyltransferase family protein [Vannielia sp.]|uniref:CDP-alcohol phosphatidyltransferase family protein n=1 Tax=Vannielia sp. TaxID=2813045 RepID=UPI0026243F3E|nr:CDP-alcohol phosphatidyltransferase family protein [Vannielia sp.]MDF1873501.1 CDP-alcohol phosphatidyltransferase family protein [Vannielia sp.]
MGKPASRRPISTRNTGWAQSAARWLAAAGATPNAISQASMLCGACGFAALWGNAASGPVLSALLLILAALACQMRLLCNLFDGMVAVEGGKGAADGPFWNEAPDRVADLLFFAGAGLAVGEAWLGLLAGALAVCTAYLRELGRAEGLLPDFCGPMAKPHRMAALTAGCVLGAVEVVWLATHWALFATLWLIALGTAATVLRRAARMIGALKALPPAGRSGT